MKNLMIAATSLLVLAAPPAFAGERENQVSLCASALETQGLAPADSFRAKFVKAKGGAVQKIVIKLISLGDSPSVDAECLIKGGEVTSAAIKS